MLETTSKDLGIKLFGKEIPLPPEDDSPTISGDDELPYSSREVDEEEEDCQKDCPTGKTTEILQSDDDAPLSNREDSAHPESLPETNVNPKTPSIDEESAKSKSSKTEKEHNDGTSSLEKTIKKPDKILPCPRCNSMDTKFCYYNNYNINQPRHFCKACQRYWTAGGTMRNVPVGAGRRKNKNSASHYRHITISEALQAARIEAPNGTNHPALKTNGRVLNFSLDVPICDSMASVLHLADQKALNGSRNGFRGLEDQKISVSCKGGGNGDDCSSGSSLTVANSMEGGRTCPQEPLVQNINGFTPPIPCLPGVPWPYPWNSALHPPAFCPPGVPMSFYPSAYWNCVIPGTWNIPLLSPQSSSSSNQNVSCTSPLSTTLGKHPRDGDAPKPESLEKEEPSKHRNGTVLVPKILRIDDPSEAAKSSIWATLGIKNESLSGGGLFKAFQPKNVEKKHVTETSSVLCANPAALSRSIKFHESS
ncbi:hypothetical protein K2173_028168 [Erythroxylum novogranatense]|uniref:Dof-type domain-containing protein n=1 Tax=Erythroxylum novogranatense TaxID=1862640 RepID=A0AAV8U140_9ROSI|nr:hypothetical protein K2173_028168 [Erythroxylum novogranatense]